MLSYNAALITLGLAAVSSALGINCRGSSRCDSGFSNAMGKIQDELQNAIAGGAGGQYFDTGAQIACVCDGDTAPIPEGAVCAFFQNGASGSIQDASNFVAQLQQHNCANCGSVPTQDGNNVDSGELTVNFVNQPGCCTKGEKDVKLCSP